MAPGRVLTVVVAALLIAAGGCVRAGGEARPAAWSRPAHLDPWRPAGVTPTARSIEIALYEDVHHIDLAECPFHLTTCARPEDDMRTPRARLDVDQVRCRAVAEHQDRCTFRLTETVAGRAPVRSRCTARFETVGTSHDPFRWGVDYGREDDPPPGITCTRGRSVRHGRG